MMHDKGCKRVRVHEYNRVTARGYRKALGLGVRLRFRVRV